MRAKVEFFVDLDAVGADAVGALDHGVQGSLYDTLDWFRLTREHVLPGSPVIVVRARSEAGSAWLFLAKTARSRVEKLGSWYTLRYAPVFAGEPDTAERTRLVEAIASALRPKLARIHLQPVDEATLGLLRDGFAQAGWLTQGSAQTVNWVAHVASDDFAAYWAKRPGQLRNTIRRKTGKADLSIRLFDTFDADAWAAYEAVFAASWKGDEGSPAFLRALGERVGSWGRLRMALGYDASGAPLAAQFWTIDGPPASRIATIHKLAYAEAAKALSPGSVLSRAMFEHVIDRDHPREIDFGTGDDPYKADWMDEKRQLYRFDAYNPLAPSELGGYLRARAAALVAGVRRA